MRKLLILTTFAIMTASCTQNQPVYTTKADSPKQITDSTDMTNNFYDNSETYKLPVKELTIEGEISNPGRVDFSKLPVHSVIVKETLLQDDGSDKFVGAYRYDGYSLFDILNDRVVKKVNAGEFGQIIDMFVEIENEKGEKVVFSWGEIYYPDNLNNILISSAVSRIVPSKTKDLWELPDESRIVAANDLITERNISSPVKITVKSFPKSFNVQKGLSPMFSKQVKLYENGKETGLITDYPAHMSEITYSTIFYGRGKGIHSTEPFKGVLLKDVLSGTFKLTGENIRKGIIGISAEDGYRCALSFSELFNRNDQQEFLLVKTQPDEDGGLFRVFPAPDFFSDRAIKSVSEIHLLY